MRSYLNTKGDIMCGNKSDCNCSTEKESESSKCSDDVKKKCGCLDNPSKPCDNNDKSK